MAYLLGSTRRKMGNSDLDFSRISTVAFLLLASGLLLTFPSFGDLLLGR
jgi:hypothetical protein